MVRNISTLILGITLIFAACDKKDSIESLFHEAEKMESDILNCVNTIAEYRANYEKILLDAPDSEFAPLACYKLGKLNEIFGHYKDAIDFYRKLLARYPENPICADGLFNMAQIYQLHLNENDEAITAYTQLVHFYPDEKVSLLGLLQLGQVLSKEEKWQDAIYYFQSIVEKYPDQPICDDLYFRMGDILQQQLKDTTKAIEMYQVVVDKFSNSTWAKYCQPRLAKLKQGGRIR
jgi:TolA-binding protein